MTKEKNVYKFIAACLKSSDYIIKSSVCETNVGTTPVYIVFSKRFKIPEQYMLVSREKPPFCGISQALGKNFLRFDSDSIGFSILQPDTM